MHHNRKVAKNRGEAWRKKLTEGRLEYEKNPSKLRLRRLDKGLTQKHVARRFVLSPGTYGEIERGKRSVKNDLASEIETFMGAKKLFKKHSASRMIAIRK